MIVIMIMIMIVIMIMIIRDGRCEKILRNGGVLRHVRP